MGPNPRSRLECLAVWGPYPDYDDIAKLEYGRLLWRSTRTRQALIAHWTSPCHPQRDRFLANSLLIEEILGSTLGDQALDAALRTRSLSLRAAAREIPTIFSPLSVLCASKKDAPAIKSGGSHTDTATAA